MPYSVPVGYFEQFTVNVNAEAPFVKMPQATVVSMQSRRTKWVSYLAAACVAVLLGIGALVVTQRPADTVKPQVNFEQQLASLSSDDIKSYLDNDPSSAPDALPPYLDQQSPDVQPLIENISTEDIQQYLNETSTPDEKRTKDI